MPDFKSTSITQPVHRVVTPLLTIRDGREEYASGTAFVIGGESRTYSG
jgi:hypothetical protein